MFGSDIGLWAVGRGKNGDFGMDVLSRDGVERSVEGGVGRAMRISFETGLECEFFLYRIHELSSWRIFES